MDGGMMVSKRQWHPISCSEVVAKIQVLGSTLGIKVATNASPAIPSKKKKKLNVSIVRVGNRGYARWDDGVQTTISSDQSFRSCSQNTFLEVHTWCKSCDKVNLNTRYAWCEDGIPMVTSSQQLWWSYWQQSYLRFSHMVLQFRQKKKKVKCFHC